MTYCIPEGFERASFTVAHSKTQHAKTEFTMTFSTQALSVY